MGRYINMEFLYTIGLMLVSIQIRFLYLEDVKITKTTTNKYQKEIRKWEVNQILYKKY